MLYSLQPEGLLHCTLIKLKYPNFDWTRSIQYWLTSGRLGAGIPPIDEAGLRTLIGWCMKGALTGRAGAVGGEGVVSGPRPVQVVLGYVGEGRMTDRVSPSISPLVGWRRHRSSASSTLTATPTCRMLQRLNGFSDVFCCSQHTKFVVH